MGFSFRLTMGLLVFFSSACIPEDLSAPAEPIGETPKWGEGFTAKDQGQKRESLLSMKNVMGGEKSLDQSKTSLSSPDLDRGQEIFQKHCASCHGIKGKGGHRMGIGAIPPVISPQVKALPSKDLYALIANGKGRMPPMKRVLDEKALKAVMAYIISLNP